MHSFYGLGCQHVACQQGRSLHRSLKPVEITATACAACASLEGRQSARRRGLRSLRITCALLSISQTHTTAHQSVPRRQWQRVLPLPSIEAAMRLAQQLPWYTADTQTASGRWRDPNQHERLQDRARACSGRTSKPTVSCACKQACWQLSAAVLKRVSSSNDGKEAFGRVAPPASGPLCASTA